MAASRARARPLWAEHSADYAFVGVAVVLAFALFHNAWASPATRLIGVSEDPVQNVWLLGFTPYALAHATAPWTTTLLDAPAGVNLLWNPLMPLAGLLLWPVTATAGPVVAYNLLATLVPVLSAVAAYVALRYLVHDRLASCAGALLYGFSPYVVAQMLGHPHAGLGVTPPLFLVLLAEIFVRQRHPAWRNGLLLALLTAVQFFLSIEMLASEVLLGVTGIVVLAVSHRDAVRCRLPHVVRTFQWAAPPIALLCTWPLTVQLFGPQHVSGTIWPASEFSADLLNLVTPSALIQFAPSSLQQIPFHIDTTSQVWSSYIGVPLLLLVATALWRGRRRFDARLLGVLFVLSVVLSLGPSLRIAGHDSGVPLPMRVVQSVPGLNNLEPDRLSLYAYLFAGILTGMLLADLRRNPPRTLLPAFAAAAVFVSLVPTFRFPTESPTVPAFFTSAAVATIPAGSTVVVLPLADAEHVAPMLWQAEAGYRFSMTGGYAIRPLSIAGVTTAPPQTELSKWIMRVESTCVAPHLNTWWRDRLMGVRHQAAVRAVIVGPASCQAALVTFISELFGHGPQWEAGVAVWILSVSR